MRSSFIRRISPVILVAGVVALSGCTAVANANGSSTVPPDAVATAGSAPVAAPTTQAPPAEPLAVTSGADADGSLKLGDPLELKATSGTLTTVKVTDEDDKSVSGSIGSDGTSWTSDAEVPPKAEWKWTAAGADGKEISGEVSTPAATKTRRAQVSLGDDKTYGIAVPIAVTFSGVVTKKAAVEQVLSVEVKPKGAPKSDFKKIEGSWAWLPSKGGGSQLHFRPKEYWPADSDVHVGLPLTQADQGKGVYGAKDITLDFHIGRSQIVKADAKKHNIVVVREGKTVATYPASYGAENDPRRVTRSGTHVVSEKWSTKQMTSATFGYSETEHWAVRINNNGEFIHANPATTADQGNTNVSHGCINLSTANAQKYFDTAIVGDPVEVTGTSKDLADDRTDNYDWALSWKQWTAMSALK